jgi:hypothetical protein
LAKAGIKLEEFGSHVELNLRDAKRIQILAWSNTRDHWCDCWLGDRGHRLRSFRLGGVTQVRSPVVVLSYFSGKPEIKKVLPRYSTVGGEFLSAARILVAARHRTKMHYLVPDAQRDGSLFRDMHSTDWITDKPLGTGDRALLRRGIFAPRDRIHESAQHPGDYTP